MNTLIIGGTGKTGSRVTKQLRAMGLPVRVGSRHSETRFDWADRTTWSAALDDIEQAYITFYPDLALPGADQIIGAFAELAAAAGVRRLVLLSGRGEEGARRSENALKDSCAEPVVLRSAFFMQNFSEAEYRHEIAAGQLSMLAHSVGEPFIDADDIASVAVAVLTEPGHGGRTYELTGPRLLTFGDAAAEISSRIGRPVAYTELGAEEYAAHLASFGVPQDVAGGIVQVFAEVLDGRNAHVTHDVADVLDRPPRDFSTYADAAAATGVWDMTTST